jgi:hypothetical protein
MTTTAQTYGPFDRAPFGGSWRRGSVGRELADTDPWSGEVLARIPLAGPSDVEEAYAEFTTHHWVSVQHVPRPYPMPEARPSMSGKDAGNA